MDAPRVEAPRVEASRAEAPLAESPRAEAPKVDAKELLSASGLQMVETDSSKRRSFTMEPEPVQLGRPRRERPAAAAEEMVQVETRNK